MFVKGIALFTIIAFMFCVCLVSADTGDPELAETQGFVSSTAISALGTVTETDSIVNIIANYAGEYSEPTLPYPLFATELAEYTSTYREETIADQGLVTYTKEMTTDTAGAAASNQYNVKTSRLVEFIGSDTGRMTSDESMVLDGAGSAFTSDYSPGDIRICPFASGINTTNPSAFCNIVEEGSGVDLTLGSLATETAQRYIMKTAGFLDGNTTYPELPISDPGVESDYSIKLTGFSDVPAKGSAQASIDVHVQEARDANYQVSEFSDVSPKAEDLVYSETSTASGDITLFQKVMKYSSEITGTGQIIFPEAGD
jgi:hypothetical protein